MPGGQGKGLAKISAAAITCLSVTTNINASTIVNMLPKI